jgi:hypothetical protein
MIILQAFSFPYQEENDTAETYIVERNNQYQYWVDLPFNTIKNKF